MGMHGGFGFGGHPLIRSIGEQRRSRQYLEGGGRPTKETVRRLWQVLRPYKRALGLAVALTVLGVVLGLVPPLIMRAIIDRALATHNIHLLLWLAGALLFFPVATSVVSLGQHYLNTVVSQGVIHDLRTALYEHGQKLGIDYFTRTPAGEIHSRLVNDLNAVQSVLSRTLSALFVNALTIVLTLTTMFYLDVPLAAIALGVLPIFALPVVWFGRRTYGAMTAAQKALAAMTAHLEETLALSGILVVKSFGTEHREAERFRALSQTVRQALVQQNLVGQWLSLVVQGLSALGPALIYGYGGYLVMAGQVKLGTVVAFATYLTQLFNPAASLAGSNTTLIGGLALFDRIFQFLDLPVTVPSPAQPRHLPPDERLGIRFDAVRFGYRAGEEVLHEVSFEARPGELTALVGPSGAGKTTVLALAARFYDPDAGSIQIGGVPLAAIDEEELRRVTSMVTQDLFLFHATLEDNIRYGRPDASPDDVWQAIEAAQLKDLVQSLPKGVYTVVGERGYRLSGGEKQRVAIARAILRNPKILLLDEATSSLDSHAERLIQEALYRLFEGRTVIAIAHRLSTILAADHIVVVDHGRIVDRGRHGELLARGGLYARLYHEQFNPITTGTLPVTPS